jgi:SAM-dependent methyltransferase
MESGAQTWHYGLIAKWWAEFNDDFRPHEIPYFQRFIERGGQPALDVACGTGRLLVTYLRAGLDVDGCDVSADMVALCREKAARDGLSPTLFVQPMHELDPPRSYKTIFVCGAFGLGSIREQDIEALMRFHKYLEPGGRFSSTSRFRTPTRGCGGTGCGRIATHCRSRRSRRASDGVHPTERSTRCGPELCSSIHSRSA